MQLHLFDLHQVVQMTANSDAQPARRVAFVGLVVNVKANVRQCRLAPKLDVHIVWLRAIGLPVSLGRRVQELVDAAARLTGGQRPDGLVTDVSYATLFLVLRHVHVRVAF